MYEYTLRLGELHWAQVCILVDVEERDKEDETSINIQRRRGRLVAKRGRRKRRLFFLKIRWEGFKAATTSLMLPWFLKMECLKKAHRKALEAAITSNILRKMQIFILVQKHR